jgi:hypothetical protein
MAERAAVPRQIQGFWSAPIQAPDRRRGDFRTDRVVFFCFTELISRRVYRYFFP